MYDEQIQSIYELEDMFSQIAKLEEKELSEYLYEEDKLRHSLYDQYCQKVQATYAMCEICYMLKD